VRDDLVVEAYEVLAELTRPICDACPNAPDRPTRCCYPEACQITEMVAHSFWGVVLPPPIPTYLTPEGGCSVAPHLRPHCAGYVCPEALAAAPAEAQQEYWELRAYIARLRAR